MCAPRLIGHRVQDLVELHNVHPLGFRIYRLQSSTDTIGILIADDATITGALDKAPTLGEARIISAVDDAGTYVLKVRTIL